MDVIYKEEFDRWIRGDRYVRPAIRRLLRGKKKTPLSGMQRVVHNFRLGLDQLKIAHSYNKPFFTIGKSQKVISFGIGINGVKGLAPTNPVIAAIGFPYPSELPDLCNRYNIRKFLQHSTWTLDFVRSAGVYSNDIFDLWPAGINTDEWSPIESGPRKELDVLIYNKIHWNKPAIESALVQPIRDYLNSKNYSYCEIVYGSYSKEEYQKRLGQAKTMIFLVEHESQGIAYQECLSSNVPVIAWDQGYFLDPIRFKYDRPVVKTTSVPFFDQRCGAKFRDFNEFRSVFEPFFENALSGAFRPREFILENLSIDKSTRRMLDIYNSI